MMILQQLNTGNVCPISRTDLNKELQFYIDNITDPNIQAVFNRGGLSLDRDFLIDGSDPYFGAVSQAQQIRAQANQPQPILPGVAPPVPLAAAPAPAPAAPAPAAAPAPDVLPEDAPAGAPAPEPPLGPGRLMGWLRGLAALPGRLMGGPAGPAPAPEPLPGPPSPAVADAPLALGPPTPAVHQPDALMTLEEFIEGLVAIDGMPNRVAMDILELLDGDPPIWVAFYRWMFDGGIIIRTWQNFIDAWDAYNGGRPRDPRDGPDGGPDGGPGGGPGGFYDPRGPGGPGGDPGAGPSGPGGGPPSGHDGPDDPPDRGDDGDGGDTAAAAAVQEDLVDDTSFDPT